MMNKQIQKYSSGTKMSPFRVGSKVKVTACPNVGQDVLNHQYFYRGLFDFGQMRHRVWSRDI